MLLFKSLAACLGEMVSTIWRLIISSAISRPVHWLMGRPASAGGAQANASSWQRWSAVILAGAPGRGKSSNRSATLNSSKGIACNNSQRLRHRFTVLRFTPTMRSIAGAVCPLPANRMILARLAICWAVLCPFSSASNSCSIAFVNSMASAFRPGISYPFLTPSLPMPFSISALLPFRLSTSASVY